MQVWKRNAIVGVVAVFVCLAVYLNWSYNSNIEDMTTDYSQFEDELTQKVIGGTALVNGDDSTAVPTANDYFASTRLARQQARDQAISILNDSGGTDGATEAVKASFAVEIQTMASNSLKESRIEGLVRAKGYADCVVFISEDSVRVVVTAPEGGLSKQDVVKICDIVLSETTIAKDKITIDGV